MTNLGPHVLQDQVMLTMWQMPKHELALWVRDGTGRGSVPLPGRGLYIREHK